jgi:hypothetical protein
VTVIIGLLLFSELCYRTWLYFHNCDSGCHNIKFFAQLDAFNRDAGYAYLATDPTLGYSLVNGTFSSDEPGRNGARITIQQGIRVNANFATTSEGGAILVVGGSYVFGDGEADNETWPAILERRLNRPVVNGGVLGYGPMQSVMRAEHLLNTRSYSLVILSLVAADVSLEQYVNFSGFHRPAIIREDGRLRYTTMEQSAKIVSKEFVCTHPWLSDLLFWSHLVKRLFPKLDFDDYCTNLIHPKAATSDEILELAIGRFAGMPVNKVILIQYPRYLFEVDHDEARNMGHVAKRYGVQVIDMYDMLKRKTILEVLHDRNEVVADLIADKIAALIP